MKLTGNYYRSADKYDLLKLSTTVKTELHQMVTLKDLDGSPAETFHSPTVQDLVSPTNKKSTLAHIPPPSLGEIRSLKMIISEKVLTTKGIITSVSPRLEAADVKKDRMQLFKSMNNKFLKRNESSSSLEHLNAAIPESLRFLPRSDQNIIQTPRDSSPMSPGKIKLDEIKVQELPEADEDDQASSSMTNKPELSRKPGEEPGMETVCFVCFDAPQNCVNIPCHHGGICMRCGLDLWSKSKKCYLCKASIESLLNIDPNTVANMCRVIKTVLPDNSDGRK